MTDPTPKDLRKAAIEAMARAICAADLRDPDYLALADSGLRVPVWTLYQDEGRGALDALLAMLPALGLTHPMPLKATDTMVRDATTRGLTDEATLYHGIFRAMCAGAPNPLLAVQEDGTNG